MKITNDTRSGRVASWMAGWVFRRVLTVLWWSWRVRVVEGASYVQSLSRRGKPILFTCWHNRIVMAAPFLLKHFHQNDLPMAVLTSASGDGELVARTVEGWGVHAVRGSSNRGARAAVRGTVKAVRQLRVSPVVIPDGPGGPPYHFKEGVVHLARLSGAPIVSVGFAADRYWSVGSWDRMMIPRPFARVSITIAPPSGISGKLNEEETSTERARQEAVLNRATHAAERAAGAAGSLPLPTGAGSPDGSSGGVT